MELISRHTPLIARTSKLHAEGLTQKIIQCLEKYGWIINLILGVRENDGASVMSGKCSAVAARIKAGLNILYCALHCTFLNLVKVDAVKSSLRLIVFFFITAEIVCVCVRLLYIYIFFFLPEMAHSSKRNV